MRSSMTAARYWFSSERTTGGPRHPAAERLPCLRRETLPWRSRLCRRASLSATDASIGIRTHLAGSGAEPILASASVYFCATK